MIHLDLIHTLNYTKKVAVRNSWERNLLIKELISMFTWIFHLYEAAFHQHLQMDYTYLSWNDVRLHEFGYPWWPCQEWTDMFGLYLLQVISLSLLTTCNHLWHMTGCWRQQHHECHLWIRTLFTIFNFCVQLQF